MILIVFGFAAQVDQPIVASALDYPVRDFFRRTYFYTTWLAMKGKDSRGKSFRRQYVGS